MQFDATLNLAWAVLGLFALAATGRVARRKDSRRRAPRGLLIVGLIVTALFPYISASDDILRLGHAQDVLDNGGATSASLHDGSQGQSQNEGRHQSDDLLRLYETVDTAVVCRLVAITFEFLLIAIVLAIKCARANRVAPAIAGRSPPMALAF